MEITTATEKKGGISVFADGEYRFTVPAFIWASCDLSDGCDAGEEALAALKSRADDYRAEEAAVRLLSLRAHSEKELKEKLRRRFSADLAEKTAETMREKGYLDDEKFAEALASELARTKHYGPRRIKDELFRRGIGKEIAENAVSALDIDKNAAIIELIAKMRLPDDPNEKEVARMLRRLEAAGYSYADVKYALENRED